jgi:hypothetical protein
MKAISLKQPYAWAVIFGGKDIENRTWNTKYRGELAIHASSSALKDYWWPRGTPKPLSGDLRSSVIIGVVDLVDVVEKSRSKWFGGPYGFVLKNPKPLREPISYKGALNIWPLPPKIIRAIVKQLG